MSDPFLRGRSIALVLTCLSNLALGTLSVVHANEVDIPYTRFVLDNGLTLIVHEDHKAPIVCVNVWYHVGSKNEKVGKTGFAHLFEHLMFNGSENFDDDYFRALDQLGATSVNGTTWLDRTNYFQNVPITALDAVLWMESDRMGHMLGAVTQEVKAGGAFARDKIVANDAALKGAVEANDLALKTRLQEHSLKVEEKLRVHEADLKVVWSNVDLTLREHTRHEVSALRDSLTAAWAEGDHEEVATSRPRRSGASPLRSQAARSGLGRMAALSLHRSSTLYPIYLHIRCLCI